LKSRGENAEKQSSAEMEKSAHASWGRARESKKGDVKTGVPQRRGRGRI